jgi:hypothetical protein
MWRTNEQLESVTGVLMCWLSESFLFAIVTRLVEREDTGLADTRADAPAYASGGVSEQNGLRQRKQ